MTNPVPAVDPAAPDWSIQRWTERVAGRQWPREDQHLLTVGPALPEIFTTSRALQEVHRLDLSLFVIFEEASLRVSGSLTRRAPDLDSLNFAAQQTIDEARHHEQFRRRLDLSRALVGQAPGGVSEEIRIPPLRTFLDHCYEVADGGSYTEGLTLMNLILEGMAYPLYAYEERYWRAVDPYLADLIHGAFVDETRHVMLGAATVRNLLERSSDSERERARRACATARLAMGEIFTYYVRKFVGLFDAVARRHQDLFAGAEMAPGHRIVDTPYDQQVAMIQTNIDLEHGRLLARAGLV